jgi:hypothetical protein
LVVYAAGGGGGADTSAGVGGSGIGGNGGLPGGALPTAGASGTGSGGGGGSSQNPSISGARGGSGIVVLRYTPVIVSATTGMVRYNSSIYSLEIYTDANDWEPLYTIGSIIFFTTSTAPAGWLKANGATVSRTTYAGLFAVIGTTFGAGDGSTTFTLPDFRGTFPRSLDDGRGVDTGRAVSSYQDQDWKGFYQTNTLQNASSGYSHGPVYMGKTTASYTGALFTGHWRAPAAGLGCMWDTSEMRPKNYALLACIKY